MIRKIIHIDEEKCNGCGACADACHEGAIGMVDGKAKLLREDYCDGLGDCLPTCPTGAITFVEREAVAYDEAAVIKNKESNENTHSTSRLGEKLPCGCPGTMAKSIVRKAGANDEAGTSDNQSSCVEQRDYVAQPNSSAAANMPSRLSQWPVQIKLAPVNAPYFEGAKLLIAADCSAYAYAGFHEGFIKGHITLIGCPKLDDVDYSEKLTEIIRINDIKSVTIVRMEVPCCGGLENAAKKALQDSGKFIPWQVVTISTDGRILS